MVPPRFCGLSKPIGYTEPVSGLESNLARIRREIEAAARRSARDPSSIRVLAVSKTFPAERVVEAAELGQALFGENRVQEAESKIPAVRRPGLEWHLIGHLQSNKVRQAARIFDVIQTVDSQKLAHRLDRICEEQNRKLKVLIQVNIGEEEQKSGIDIGDVEELVRIVTPLEHLELRGFMAIPPLFGDPELSRPYFRRLAALRAQIEARLGLSFPELSMGMSSDFSVAVEEGATIVRIGTGIFGERD